jgi:hypothetical protein
MAAGTAALLFVRNDGSFTTAMFLLLLSVPLFYANYSWGMTCFMLCLLLATCNAVQDVKEEDKHAIRLNVMDAHDVVEELRKWAQTYDRQATGSRLAIKLGLAALAKKYSKATTNKQKRVHFKDNRLGGLCLEAAYIGFRAVVAHNHQADDDDDDVTSASLSLAALVAKDPVVQQMFESNEYDLGLPIQVMRQALERCQDYDTTRNEQRAAELQRKGCLLLGAVCDGNTALSRNVAVDAGGLDAILAATTWFPYHAHVCNWALWAIFVLMYENHATKLELVRRNGVPTIVHVMSNCVPDCVDVARHGTAILFDLMREPNETPCSNEGPKLDVWKVRQQALQAGLHVVLAKAMVLWSDEMDIMMMGQEILIGTGYKGDIPEY